MDGNVEEWRAHAGVLELLGEEPFRRVSRHPRVIFHRHGAGCLSGLKAVHKRPRNVSCTDIRRGEVLPDVSCGKQPQSLQCHGVEDTIAVAGGEAAGVGRDVSRPRARSGAVWEGAPGAVPTGRDRPLVGKSRHRTSSVMAWSPAGDAPHAPGRGSGRASRYCALKWLGGTSRVRRCVLQDLESHARHIGRIRQARTEAACCPDGAQRRRCPPRRALRAACGSCGRRRGPTDDAGPQDAERAFRLASLCECRAASRTRTPHNYPGGSP